MLVFSRWCYSTSFGSYHLRCLWLCLRLHSLPPPRPVRGVTGGHVITARVFLIHSPWSCCCHAAVAGITAGALEWRVPPVFGGTWVMSIASLAGGEGGWAGELGRLHLSCVWGFQGLECCLRGQGAGAVGSGWLEGLGLQVLLTLLLASLWLWSLLGPQEAGIVCLISAAAPGSLGLQAQPL